jgi:hypothetical protein
MLRNNFSEANPGVTDGVEVVREQVDVPAERERQRPLMGCAF